MYCGLILCANHREMLGKIDPYKPHHGWVYMFLIFLSMINKYIFFYLKKQQVFLFYFFFVCVFFFPLCLFWPRFKYRRLLNLSRYSHLICYEFFLYEFFTFSVTNWNKFSFEIWSLLVLTDLYCFLYHLRLI